MFNETYCFSLVRQFEDGTVENISIDLDVGEDMITHGTLAKAFNRFLTSCGYHGHNYVNSPEK